VLVVMSKRENTVFEIHTPNPGCVVFDVNDCELLVYAKLFARIRGRQKIKSSFLPAQTASR
jgi:hypothetical protein